MTTCRDIQHIAQSLLQGRTLLYPTDTIWGIGCDATNGEAIQRLYAIKQRDLSKSMLVLMSDVEMLHKYIPNPTPEAISLLLNHERPTTVIFPLTQCSENHSPAIHSLLIAQDGTIGVRIPQHTFCHDLILALGRPLVSTSANLSGHPSPTGFNSIDSELKERIDLITDPIYDTSSDVPPSRILKVTSIGEIIVIRD